MTEDALVDLASWNCRGICVFNFLNYSDMQTGMFELPTRTHTHSHAHTHSRNRVLSLGLAKCPKLRHEDFLGAIPYHLSRQESETE